MKLVQVVTRSDNIGGSQVHVRDLAVELQNRGCSVCVLVGGEGPFLEEIKECGIPVQTIHHLVRAIHPYHDWCAFLEICRALRCLQPDLVATHTSKAGWIGRMAARSLGIPVLFTAHGWSFIQVAPGVMKKIYILAEKIAANLSSRVITVSEYDRIFCLKHHMVSPDKVITIHNGIPDIPYIIPNQVTYSPRFIMTARLEKPKNHKFLLRALSSLTNENWRLDLLGEGPLRTEIEQRISGLHLTSKVRLLGARRDVPKLLCKAQGFILLSDMEGLPISILEAMRAGLPIIASDVGGVAETVEDGVNGFLIPHGNLEVLIDRLKILISNQELRQKMGLASRGKYEKQFSLTEMVDKTLGAYSEILFS